MRWKERFLVPDWRVKDITGASFAGFYYVCVSTPDPEMGTDWDKPATMSGYYFHQNSDPYQKLSLVHVSDGSDWDDPDDGSACAQGSQGWEWR